MQKVERDIPSEMWSAAVDALLASVGLSRTHVYIALTETRPVTGKCLHDDPVVLTISAPLVDDESIYVLAHECGHVALGMTSRPAYLDEYMAELWAQKAFQEHLGRPVPDALVESGKHYVRLFCQRRLAELGAYPMKGWNREAVEWCGFAEELREAQAADQPGYEMRFFDWREDSA